jgi:hypothetical protein
MHGYRRIAALDAKDMLHNVACAACKERCCNRVDEVSTTPSFWTWMGVQTAMELFINSGWQSFSEYICKLPRRWYIQNFYLSQ